MRTLTALLLIVAFSPLCTFAAPSSKGEPTAKPKKYKLSEDPKAVVISLNFKGGYTPPRKGNAPTLSILADGTVLIPDNYGMSKDVKTRISEPELQELLRLIIDENKFFEYDKAKVEAKIKEASKPKPGQLVFQTVVADAATTVIYVKADGKEHEASRYALSMLHGPQKEVKELHQLLAIQRALQQIMTVAHAGGPVEVTKIVKLANEHLLKKYPEAKPLKDSHLRSAGTRKDGSKYYFLQRSKQGKDGNAKTNTFTNVQIQIPAGGEPKVTVNAKLK